MTISDGKIAGAVIAAVVILMCCFLKNGKKCRRRPRLQSGEPPVNESSLERNQASDPLNGHIPLPGFGFDSTLPVRFCTIRGRIYYKTQSTRSSLIMSMNMHEKGYEQN